MPRILLCLASALLSASTLAAQQVTASALPDAPQPTSLTLVALAAGDASTVALDPSQTSSSAAQAVQQPATQPQQPGSDQQHRETGDQQIQEEEHQRIAGVLPAFNSVAADKAVPLTPGQKFHLFFRGSVDPYQFVLAGINAGIEQAEDTYPEYHQGFPGYARRYGASFADTWDGNFWGNAVLPSLFHQDPRYFRLGRESGKTSRHRFLYAMSTTIIAHGDNGKLQPNYSNVLGNFIGGAISNVYYPASARGVGHTLDNALTTTAEGIIGAELIEFYPDYVSWRQHRRERKLAARLAAQSSTVATPKDASDGAAKAQDVSPQHI